MDLDYLVYLLKYDSVHGIFPFSVKKGEKSITVDGHKVDVFTEKDPKNIKWGTAGANIVCESTGVFFNTRDC